MLKRLLFVFVLILLAACSTTTSTEGDSDPVPTREDTEEISGDRGAAFGLSDAPPGSGFAAHLDGAESLNVSGVGLINCENNVYVIRASQDTFPLISLILPAGASPGTFNLVNNPGDGSAASATVFFADGRVFAISVNGTLIVTALPSRPGEPVSGSFDFSASSGAQTINARGEFDFISAEDTTFCP